MLIIFTIMSKHGRTFHLPKFSYTPSFAISISKVSHSQVHRLSKLVCKRDWESHRQQVGVGVRWGLAGLDFEHPTPFASN